MHSPSLPLHRQNKEVWVSGLNQHTANVPNRKVPKVRILLLPHFGSLAQLDQSTTLRTSVSGVRVSHESQHWSFGRLGVCAGLKIPKTRLHEAPLKNSGVLQWQRGWTVNPLSDDFVGSSPTSRTQLALWYNGSTTGFGPVSEGSIPSGATS